MARPNKAGLDYFPLDVNVDDKIELIEAKHGLVGFGIVIKLFQQIYKNGYFMEITEDRLLLLKKNLGVSLEMLNSVIKDSLKWNLFNEGIFEKYGVLTSCGIQNRYIEATKRRKEVSFIKEYLLVDNVKDKYLNRVNVSIERVNVNINPKKDDSSTQSKVKYSKVKYSIEKTLPRNDELFIKFWAAYPKKKSKGDAEKAWKKLKPSLELTGKIIVKVELLKKTHDWRKEGGQFIPFPATWLNRKGWEDEVNVEIEKHPMKGILNKSGQGTFDNIQEMDLTRGEGVI